MYGSVHTNAGKKINVICLQITRFDSIKWKIMHSFSVESFHLFFLGFSLANGYLISFMCIALCYMNIKYDEKWRYLCNKEKTKKCFFYKNNFWPQNTHFYTSKLIFLTIFRCLPSIVLRPRSLRWWFMPLWGRIQRIWVRDSGRRMSSARLLWKWTLHWRRMPLRTRP